MSNVPLCNFFLNPFTALPDSTEVFFPFFAIILSHFTNIFRFEMIPRRKTYSRQKTKKENSYKVIYFYINKKCSSLCIIRQSLKISAKNGILKVTEDAEFP